MGNKLIKIVLFLALIAGMTGIAAAECVNNGDCLSAVWTGSEIRAEAWNLMPMWYEIRFYAPGVLPASFETIVETHNNPSDPVYPFSVGPKFDGATCTSISHCVRTYTPTPLIPGDWMVVLMKDGTNTNPNPTVQNSYRVSVPVNIPIPEFPIVAMPIAAVLGLLFYFQHSKSKKE